MSFIQLNEAEERLARYLGKRRYSNNRKEGVADAQVGKQTKEEIDLQGVAGEIAVAKHLNLYPDLGVEVRSGSWDLRTHSGLTIDVKTTSYHSGKLVAPMGTSVGKADVYVLVVGTIPTFRIVGWAFAKSLVDESRIADLGYGPTYALEQEWLEKPERLRDL